MTVRTLVAGVPQIPLPGLTVLKLEAISPTTGAAITGVTVTDIAVYGIDLSAALGTLLTDLIPLYTPDEVAGLNE